MARSGGNEVPWRRTLRVHGRRALGTAVVAYGSTLLGLGVDGGSSSRSPVLVVVHGAAVVIVLAVVVFLVDGRGSGVPAATRERRERLFDRRAIEADRVVERTAQAVVHVVREPVRSVRWVPHDADGSIQKQVDALFRTFAALDRPGVPGEHVNFQAVLMVPSPDDGLITIKAWANQQGRSPKSLALRPSDPLIYARSLTAEMFEASARGDIGPMLVASTARAGDGFKALYPGQKDTVRSTINHPIYGIDRLLRASLVVHCDQDDYFNDGNFDVCCEVIHPRVKQIALECHRVEAASSLSDFVFSPGVGARPGSMAASEQCCSPRPERRDDH